MPEPDFGPLNQRVQDLINLFRQAEDDLNRTINSALTSGGLGTKRYRGRVLTEVKAIINDLRTQAGPEARGLIEFSYQHGLDLLEPRVSAGRPNLSAINTLSGSLRNRLDDSIRTVGRSVNDVFKRATLLSVAQAQARTETSRPAAKRLVEALRSEGKTAFTARNGAHWSLEIYSEMAARTTAREAATEGVLQGMQNNGLDLVTISSGGSDDECALYQGNTYSLSGETPGYEVLDEYPPFHPNCVHVMYPAEDNWSSLLQEATL